MRTDLTQVQRDLLSRLEAAADGRDLRDVLRELNVPAADKAAVAEVLGGPEASSEFLG